MRYHLIGFYTKDSCQQVISSMILKRKLVHDDISPLWAHSWINVDYAWHAFAVQMQTMIFEYGKDYMCKLREGDAKAKITCQNLTEVNYLQDLTPTESASLCQAKHFVQCNDHIKLPNRKLESSKGLSLIKVVSLKSFSKAYFIKRNMITFLEFSHVIVAGFLTRVTCSSFCDSLCSTGLASGFL